MFFNRRIPLSIRESYYYDSATAIIWGLFWGTSVAFFPVIARKMGASNLQMAFLSMAPFIGSLFTLYWSRLSSNTNEMHFFILIKFLARIVLFLMCLAINPFVFIIVVFLNSFFEQAGSPAYVGIMKQIYPENYRGRSMGYVRVERAISAIFACWIGGILLDHYSYRYIFALSALLGVFSLNYFRKIKIKSYRNSKKVSGKKSIFPKEILEVFRKDKRFLFYSIAFFTWGFGNLLAMPLYPIFLVDNLNLSNTLVGRLSSLSSFMWIFSYFFWGKLIDKKGPIKSLLLASIISSFIPFLYANAHNIWPIIFASIFSGFNVGGGELSRISYITKISSPREVQTYWGIDFTLMGIRGIIAPMVGINLMKFLGIRIAFIGSFGVILLGFILMMIFNFYYNQGGRSVL